MRLPSFLLRSPSVFPREWGVDPTRTHHSRLLSPGVQSETDLSFHEVTVPMTVLMDSQDPILTVPGGLLLQRVEGGRDRVNTDTCFCRPPVSVLVGCPDTRLGTKDRPPHARPYGDNRGPCRPVVVAHYEYTVRDPSEGQPRPFGTTYRRSTVVITPLRNLWDPPTVEN